MAILSEEIFSVLSLHWDAKEHQGNSKGAKDTRKSGRIHLKFKVAANADEYEQTGDYDNGKPPAYA